ncbi:RcgR family putative quorum lactone hydrolase [Tabrizicola sp.]|uniref:RcgR family putative quorum lactone hydrolase n=1 Tax=Tabrizicola sp. TaxID=2005166 RepID=UPI003F3CFDBB
MYCRWLDRWDERRAERGEALKEWTAFALDAALAFPDSHGVTSLAEFCTLADHATADPTFFAGPSQQDPVVDREDGWIRFTSSLPTGIAENDLVWAKVTEARSSDRALVVFHHWNASRRSPKLANFFSRRGITVIEMALPYHLERSRPSSSHADHMLSPNLGRTIQSVRQAVLDGRKLIHALQNQGYGDISVLGMSLGAWVAGLIAAHDPAVKRAALLLSAGSLADMVWTGRATRHIRASLEAEVGLANLRRAWAPLNLENYADKLARTDLDLQFVFATRDTVVLPELGRQLVAKLRTVGVTPGILELNCGHYSLSLPPNVIWAGLSVLRLLSRSQ